MTRIRCGGPGRMLCAALPRELADLRIRHVVMDVRELLGLWVLRPDALRSAEIRNAGFGGNTGASQHDDARRLINATACVGNRGAHVFGPRASGITTPGTP